MADQYTYDAIFNDMVEFLGQHGNGALGNDVNAALLDALKSSDADIRDEYERERDFVKNEFMQYRDEHLDRHKCVACFMVAFLRKLNTDALDKNPSVSKLIREKIAIDVGLSVLVTMIQDRKNMKNNPHRKDDNRLIKFLSDNGDQFDFPDPLCDEGDYIHNWALGLYYDRRDNTLSILGVANVLYLLEIHNRHVARENNGRAKPSRRPAVFSVHPANRFFDLNTGKIIAK